MAWLALLVMAAAAAVLLPSRLTRARWVYRAPRLGVMAWLTLGYASVIAVLTAATSLVMQWHTAGDLFGTALRICTDAIRGAHGRPAQTAAVAGLAVAVMLVVRLSLGAWLVSFVTRLQRRRHAELVDFIGVRSDRLGATVVPHPAPAAYVVPGRHPQMVITTGALDALDQEQTQAVLAHERAHCAGRHHMAVAAARVLARAFPWIRACRHVEDQVRRLVEFRADDLAIRGNRPIALARALVVMSNAPAMPHGGLDAGGRYTVERLHRLLDPPPPLPVIARSTLAACLGSLPVVPFVVTLLDLAVA